MNRSTTWFRAALMFVCFAVPSAAFAADVPSDCERERWVSHGEVREALSRRSAEIVNLAMRGHTAALAPLVSPSATFTVWEGDAGSGREVGPSGAVEFANRLQARDFQAAVVFPGPISSDICGSQQVTVWFTQAERKRTYIADFKYLKGRLVEAVAHMATLLKGKVGGR